jgi:hypothetical protein
MGDFWALKLGLSGGLTGPQDSEYQRARRVWNGMIDRRPGSIARRATVGARSGRLPVAIRGGGHNIAGNAVYDGGLGEVPPYIVDNRLEQSPAPSTGLAGAGHEFSQAPDRASAFASCGRAMEPGPSPLSVGESQLDRATTANSSYRSSTPAHRRLTQPFESLHSFRFLRFGCGP